MKFRLLHLLLLLACAAPASFGQAWELDWMDDFDAPRLDPAVWTKVTRGTSDWDRHMSHGDSLYELRDGSLVLRGMRNLNQRADTAPYVTGGVWTKKLKAFEPGRIEIRARLGGARGAWPALWLLPWSDKWPDDGEIDIMERLNSESRAHQSVHSVYTLNLHQENNPPHSTTYPIDPDGWNVYGVDITEDSLTFHINGHKTLTYPKKNGGRNGQYPFFTDYYLVLDMQLGGQWVGRVNLRDLPVEMEIDWVKHYLPAVSRKAAPAGTTPAKAAPRLKAAPTAKSAAGRLSTVNSRQLQTPRKAVVRRNR